LDIAKTNKLYNSFDSLYRERFAPLESSNMPWGFQCGNGWYSLIEDMSAQIALLPASNTNSPPAISEISRNANGSLKVVVANTTLLIDRIVFATVEKSKTTCETCGFQFGFTSHNATQATKIECKRCVGYKLVTPPRRRRNPAQRDVRGVDPIVLKR
jgi:hypothetical protein